MEKSKVKEKSFFERNGLYILGFTIPLGIMIVLYMLKNIFPFGDEMYLRSDCYHQYAPFMQEFYNKMHSGGSLFYSWNIGSGSNFSALYAYYLASPLNWLIYFAPKGHITEVVSFFIVLKTSLCGLTFTIYLSKHHKMKNVSMAAFAIFYALSSYMAAYSWNIMWLDLMVLLPIVVLGLENLVLRGKCFLYIISLGFCIFSNYYIAIMICIYSVLYFFVLLYIHRRKYTGHFTIAAIIKFFFSSLLAGGIGMAMVLPEYFALLTTQSSNLDVPTQFMNYFSVLDMLSRSLMCVDCAIFEPHDPNVYCTVLVFLLIPVYCISKKINYKEKIAKLALLAFMLLSFNTNVLNFIWHGFHYPNSLPARESFIYIFLILTMCYEAWTNVGTLTRKQLFSIFAGVIFLFLIIEKLFVGEEYPFYIVYVSMGFIIIYTAIFRTYKKNLNNCGWVVYLFFIACIAESAINMDVTGLGTTSRSAYLDDNENIKSVIEHVANKDDEKFYRTEKVIHRTKNDAAWNNYKGVSLFSSSASGGLTKFYGKMGFENSFNAYSFYGYTPLTASILDVKYMLSTKDAPPMSTYELVSSIEDELNIFKNDYSLPLAFMVKSNFIQNFDLSTDNPFYTQNEFVSAASDTKEIFHQIHTQNTANATVNARIDELSDVYAYVNNKTLTNATAHIYDAEGALIDTINISIDKKPRICRIGLVPADGSVEIVKPESTENTASLNVNMYSFNLESFKEFYNELSDEGIKITSFKDTKIKGSIDVKEDGLLFTSIPFDKGWTVKVDGKKVETKSIKDGFLGIDLKSGSHKIEFTYFPQGLKAGLLISTISVLILIIAFILSRKSELERKARAKNRRRTSEANVRKRTKENIIPQGINDDNTILEDINVEDIDNDIKFEEEETNDESSNKNENTLKDESSNKNDNTLKDE